MSYVEWDQLYEAKQSPCFKGEIECGGELRVNQSGFRTFDMRFMNRETYARSPSPPLHLID